MSLTLAILGRPNVGKSTLFNRLVQKRLAIVDDTPGVTRDRRTGEGKLADLRFTAIDTAGFEDVQDDSLEARMRKQTERAIDDADLSLLLIDARAGVTPLDAHFADWLRRKNKPVILIANKCEGRAGEAGLYEAYALGLGDPIAISAEHGDGMAELYDALAPFADEDALAAGEEIEPWPEEEAAEEPEEDQVLQLAIVGRPNVGKSTLLNRLIGDERVLTGPEAGITRDAIAVEWTFEGRKLRLVDTAGLRRQARVTGKLEEMSGKDALRAIRFAQVVLLVLDGQTMLERQDLTVARRAIDEGRVLVIGVNKWDLVKDKQSARRDLRERLEDSLPQARGIATVEFSALTGQGIAKLLPRVFAAFDVWNKRVATGPLNRWLDEAIERHPPPVVGRARMRLRYATQAKTRPPTFVVFTSKAGKLPDAYMRYLVNGIRERFALPGVPIRLHLRAGKNPYAKS